MLLLALGIKLYFFLEDRAGGEQAQQIMEQLAIAAPPRASEDSATKEDDSASMDYNVAGVLSIPTLALTLPVLSQCTDELLKVSVCLYGGNVTNPPQRLIIAGHDYKSHFGNIPEMALGNEIRFTSLDGIETTYHITEITAISESDFEGLEQGDWDITLFTCDFIGNKRILVRGCIK